MGQPSVRRENSKQKSQALGFTRNLKNANVSSNETSGAVLERLLFFFSNFTSKDMFHSLDL